MDFRDKPIVKGHYFSVRDYMQLPVKVKGLRCGSSASNKPREVIG